MFPAEMKRVYLNTSLYGLKCVSSICLLWDQVYNGYKDFVMDHDAEDIPLILCITNGKIVNKLTGPDVQLLPVLFEYYDLVFHKERLKDDKNYNQKYKYQITRLHKGHSLANLPPTSTVHFVDITVHTNGQKYTLDFGINNFYMEGNRLCDKAFLCWYLKTLFKVDLVEPYTCTIMDADINCITLDANSYIVIQKETYVVITNAVVTNAVVTNAVVTNAVVTNAVASEASLCKDTAPN
jgi:hypothetical protein